jgi:tRNA pseudouridine38-40 synthase
MNGRRVAVKIAYSGKDFSGSQVQPGLVTVMGEVARALVLTGDGREEEWFDPKCSSRTDAGVNALGNVIVFNTFFEDGATMLKALNGASKTVHFRGFAYVPDDFNVRYADTRVYRYVMPKSNMDMELVRECASLFSGYHDFARFCKYDGKPTDMTLERMELTETESTVEIVFESRYFLWNQIRRICSAIIRVGKGNTTIDEVKAALNDLKETNFGVARADALTLMDVRYEGLEFEFPDVDTLRWKKDALLFTNALERSFLDDI